MVLFRNRVEFLERNELHRVFRRYKSLLAVRTREVVRHHARFTLAVLKLAEVRQRKNFTGLQRCTDGCQHAVDDLFAVLV